MSVATPPIGIPSVVPSAASPPVRRMTAAEFEFWPEQKGKELDDGVVVAVNVGTESSVIAGELYRRLANHVIDQRLGMAFPPETAFRCFPGHPNRARKPDVSFVAAQRMPSEGVPRGYMTIAPDLAVEVVSPRDVAGEVDRKVREYGELPISLLWVIFPDTVSALIYRNGRAAGDVAADESLDGEPVVPGFRVRLRDLFPGGAVQAPSPAL